MPAILGPAAQNIQRDVAGFTHVPEPNPGAPVARTVTDFLESIPTEYGDLHHLFSDNLPVPVDTGLATPTQAAVGPHGGLRYQIGKWIPVGPEPAPATAPPTLTPGVGYGGTGLPTQPATMNLQPYPAQNVGTRPGAIRPTLQRLRNWIGI